ncbi:MAG: ABC transporter permease [Candidatus Odinarchaeota archaeon]
MIPVSMKRKVVMLSWLVRSNLKQSAISLASLIIAITILASFFYYTEFTRNEVYQEVFDETGIKTLEYRNWASGDIGLTYQDAILFRTLVEEKINDHGLGEVLEISPYSPSSTLQQDVIIRENNENVTVSGHYGINEAILNECVTGSRLPVDQTEILLVAPDNTTLGVEDEVTLAVTYLSNSNATQYNISLTVAGIITGSTVKEDPLLSELFSADRYHCLMPLNHYLSFVQQVDQELESPDRYLFHIQKLMVNINSASINAANAEEIVNAFMAFSSEMEQYISNLIISSNSRSMIIKYKLMEIDAYSFLFMIISIPALVLVIILVFFSLGIANEKRQKLVALAKTRGVSGKFIFLELVLETLIVALIACTASTVVGIPLVMLVGASSGFLTFTEDFPGYGQLVKTSSLQGIFTLGIIFTFLLNLPSVIKLSRSRIVTLEQEASKKKKRKIKVLTSQFDILLLVTGGAGIITINMFLTLLNQGLSDEYRLLLLLTPFILLLLIGSPILFVIGAVLSYNRFILVFIHVLSRVFWKRNWWLPATAARNMLSNVSVTNRTAVLVSISLSFLLILSIVPVSSQKYQVESLYYDIGADFNIMLYKGSEKETSEIETALEDIPGLKTTAIVSYAAYNGHGEKLYFQGIKPGFQEIAHWQSTYGDESLTDLVTKLFDAPENNTVIMDSRTAAIQNVTLERNYYIRLREQELLEVKPVSVTSYFPGFFTRWSADTMYFVCKYGFVNNQTFGLAGTVYREILGKIMPDHDPLKVISQVKETLERLGYSTNDPNFRSVAGALEESKEEMRYIWIIINNNFMNGLIVILAAILVYNYTRIIQHAREIGLGRSLGMKYRQLFILLLIEPLATIPLKRHTGRDNRTANDSVDGRCIWT